MKSGGSGSLKPSKLDLSDKIIKCSNETLPTDGCNSVSEAPGGYACIHLQEITGLGSVAIALSKAALLVWFPVPPRLDRVHL